MNAPVTKETKSTAVHKSLYQALAAAQAEMGPALKDSTNPAFKSRYADLASVMAACLPALNAHGIAVMQPPCEIEGQRYVKTILAHDSGETAECLVPLIVQKNDMQGYGSAVTYARRYGLMAMAGVAPDDDDGNAAAAAAPKHDDRPRQAEQRPSVNFAGVADKMVAALRKNGLSVTDDARFAADLKRLRSDSPENAARVEAEINTLREAASADLGGDSIPY